MASGLQESVAISRCIGDTPSLGYALMSLSLCQLSAGNAASAHETIEEALRLFQRLGIEPPPAAEELRTKLGETPASNQAVA